MASNGIGDLGQYDFMNKGMYPMSQIDRSYYSTPSQLPLAAQAAQSDYDPETNPLTGEPVSRFAKGGITTLHYAGEDSSLVEDPAPEVVAPPTMSDLAEQLKTYYRTDQNYDDLWKQFAATKEQDPTEWYKKQLDFLGQQQGWQIGQNRSDRLSGLQPQIDNTIAEAKAAGISDKEINSILNRSSLEGNAANQQRIATLSEVGGSGYNFSKDLRPGMLMVGAAALGAYGGETLAGAGALEGTGGVTVGAPIAEPALGITTIAPEAATTGSTLAPDVFAGLSETGSLAGTAGTTVPAGYTAAAPIAAETAGTVSQALPYTEAFDAANMAKNGFDAATITQNLAGSGVNEFMAADIAGMASNGMSPEAIQQAMQYGYNAKELAPLGLQSLQAAPAAASSGLTTKQLMLANYGLKTLSGAMGGESGQGGTYATSSTPQMQQPSQQYIQPTMLGQQKYGELYRPYTYDYTRHAAQGGVMYADGGGISTLGSYSDGGRLLKGPGDGMSDDIPAHIGGDQPAALADGEFVIPADVVSHLGNGSTDAGAKQLYKMMDKIRHARTGNSKQGKQINPDKFLPKG